MSLVADHWAAVVMGRGLQPDQPSDWEGRSPVQHVSLLVLHSILIYLISASMRKRERGVLDAKLCESDKNFWSERSRQDSENHLRYDSSPETTTSLSDRRVVAGERMAHRRAMRLVRGTRRPRLQALGMKTSDCR